MVPEIGQISLALALCLAIALAVFPLAGAHAGNSRWMDVARPCALGTLAFTALAFAMLAVSFFRHDFSVQYVALHSNLKLPAMYRFAAIWGAHEGSLVLWQLILSAWTAAVALASRTLPQVLRARVLGVLGLVSIGFLLFILLTSNPFMRLFPAAADGADLNPLLQDPALAIHPPLLYMGYVGLAVPFAFAIAALLSGRLDRRWARWTRPWTTAAWMFLTVGIALGSWWAYYELGWGGWWFWDPVENASFMPWLAGTALIHTLAVTERRGLFGKHDPAAGDRRLRPEPARHLPGPFRRARVGACLRQRPGARAFHPGVPGDRDGWRAACCTRSGTQPPILRPGSSWFHASPRCWSTRSCSAPPRCWCCSARSTRWRWTHWTWQDFGGTAVFQPGLHSPHAAAVAGGGRGHARFLEGDRYRRLGAQAEGARRRCGSCRSRPHGRGLRICGNIDRHRDTHRRMGHCLGAARPVAWLLRRGPRPRRSTWGMQVAHCGLGVTTLGIVVVSAWGVETDRSLALGESLEVSDTNSSLIASKTSRARITRPRRVSSGFPAMAGRSPRFILKSAFMKYSRAR